MSPCYLQAADSLAEHASRNSSDAEYESPYTEEAIRSGMDLPWWQKIITTSLDFGELKLGKLTVSVRCERGRDQAARACYYTTGTWMQGKKTS